MDTQIERLSKLEGRALKAIRDGRPEEAIPVLEEIVVADPEWNHGSAHYSLAGCYEDIGYVIKARQYYQHALRASPGHDVFLGGYASFLYQHGDPREAFDAYLRLLEAYALSGLDDEIAATVPALAELGNRLCWTSDKIQQEISAARDRGISRR